jgi:hypothetical protein
VSYYEQPSAFKGRFFPEYAALSVEQWSLEPMCLI